MSEADRTGQIRLAVDQEVFIESVQQDHKVEDANVATEVTSFERAGDAYVLEGAIVFAAYLTKAEAGPDGAPYSKHVHHRMPFTLRVPTQFQPRGVVNVASRISDWQLDVISDGWLRVQAALSIVGLNGKHGYHFQCGAQEEGDVLFGARVPAAEAMDAAEVADDINASAADSEQLVEDSFELVRGDGARDFESAPESKLDNLASQVSQARGGVSEGQPGDEKPAANVSAAAQTDAVPEQPSVRDELVNLDKHVQTGLDETEGANLSLHQSEATPHAEAESSEFEFQHQVDLKKVPLRAEEPPSDETSAELQPAVQAKDESFVASRGFSEDGFQATSGFIPTVRVGAQASDNEPDEETSPPENDQRSALVDTSLWSFVDFNAPDNYYTLRYVIVMDEESLGSVAERVGCSEGDLLRMNRINSDSVAAGQVLKAPGRPAMSPS
ncbi:LysM peptidoglycan-binding domain-containing protein [Alicyclobacillus ferrooxydans]|uniref:LysM domain-containing protein n=1 Tax=Alicyclobacillus ferrooxydans TaxID=471514 RepID=A0A0P9CCA0_9BACL|nr:LysM peptidoglycan-binding domain-containing protein [Alicyclobacillus ferrooxydans]KPV43219.1 hypothetical protein AN477_13260 [Alicyclobacillus ferrooxydans]